MESIGKRKRGFRRIPRGIEGGEKLEFTEKNCRVADRIMEILVEEECTVDAAQDILSSVARETRCSSTVQMGEKFSERCYE